MNAQPLLVKLSIRSIVLTLFAIILVNWVGAVDAQGPIIHHDGEHGSCRLPNPAFCDTFDTPHPGGRGGDLDEAKWSVYRVGGGVNPGQQMLMIWNPTIINKCRNFINVQAPLDFAVCNQHFMEAMNDGSDYRYSGLRARQLFDFSRRTGKIVFDVDAKAAGHGWWIEAWIADEPVPGPYVGAPSNNARPKNGIGFVFGHCDSPNTGGLDRVYIVRDYVRVNTLDVPAGDTPLHTDGCFTTQDNAFNKIEIRLSTSRFEVWASDAGEDSLRRVGWSSAKEDGWSLNFSKGYVNFLHVQYNAEKSGHIGNQTYHWDNIGFDGPVYPLSRGYDIPDAGIDSKDPRFPPGTLNLGYQIGVDGKISSCCDNGSWRVYPNLVFENVNLADAAEARLNMNLWYFTPGDHLYYRFNGGDWRSFLHPYPDPEWGAKGLSIPVLLSDLRNGRNTLELKASGNENFVAANIDLELTLPPPDVSYIFIPVLHFWK
jgi:hypothetical protein